MKIQIGHKGSCRRTRNQDLSRKNLSFFEEAILKILIQYKIEEQTMATLLPQSEVKKVIISENINFRF